MGDPLTLLELLDLLPRAWLAVGGLVLGLTFGSFLNVVIYRLPLGLSVSRPRSFCPHCKSLVRWHQNVPVLSYLFLGGRCAHCRAPIPFRYPLVELATGVLFAAALYRWGVSWAALASCVFGAAMLVLGLIDRDHQILPNVITLPGIVAGFGLALLSPRVRWIDSALGIVVGGGLLYLVAWLYLQLRKQEGMGMGDVKMIAMIGAFLGWQGALLTIFIGSLLGSIVGIALMRRGGGGWDRALPFGTFLALAAVIVDWGGPELVTWYLGLMGVR